MTLAYNYPILDLIWTMFMFFVFILWIWLLIAVFMDIFRSHDLGGWAKAIWVFFIIILPFLWLRPRLPDCPGWKRAPTGGGAGGPAAEGLRRLRQADRRNRAARPATRPGEAGRPEVAGRDHRCGVRGPEGQDPRLTSPPSDGPVAAPRCSAARRAATAASAGGPRTALRPRALPGCRYSVGVTPDPTPPDPTGTDAEPAGPAPPRPRRIRARRRGARARERGARAPERGAPLGAGDQEEAEEARPHHRGVGAPGAGLSAGRCCRSWSSTPATSCSTPTPSWRRWPRWPRTTPSRRRWPPGERRAWWPRPTSSSG